MQSNKSNFLKNYGVFLFFIGVFVFLYFLNAIFPTQSDDMGRGIGGISAAITSYNNWNGRFGELLLVAFGSHLSTTPFYAPINAIVGTAVIFLVFLLIFARKPEFCFKDFSILLILIAFLMIDRVFSFGSVFYWAAGSFNYLWAWFLIILWILPYRFYWQSFFDNLKYNNGNSNKILTLLFLMIIGFLAGWSTELGIVFVFLQVCLILYSYFVLKNHLPIWYFFGVFSIFFGWLFLYMSPGLSERIRISLSYGGTYLSLSQILSMSPVLLIKTIFNTYDRVVKWFYYENYILISLFLIISSFLYRFSPKKLIISMLITLSLGLALFLLPRLLFLIYVILILFVYAYIFRKTNRKLSMFFVIMSLVLFCELLFIGATIQVSIPRRASFQYTILNFILISIIMKYCFDIFADNFKIRLIAFICCVLFSFCVFSFVSFECYDMYLKWSKMLESIKEQKNNGIKDVIVDKNTFISTYWSYGDWGNPDENFDEWPNTLYAEVYGVDTFTVK